MLNLINLFLLFLLPLVVLPIGNSFFEIPKVIIFEFLTEVLLVLYLLKSKKADLFNTDKKLLLIAGFLLILSIVHLILFNAQISFFGNPFRRQGIFLLWHLVILALINSRMIIKRYSVVALLSSLVLLGSIFIVGTDQSGRAVGTLGEANSLAAVAVYIWPFLFFTGFFRQGGKAVQAFSVIFVGLVIYFSGSRSGLLALLIQLLFLFLLKVMHRSIAVSLIICIVVLLATLSLPFIEGGGWFENRAEIWQTAFLSGLESPVFGHGFGNITDSLKQTSIELNNNAQYQFIDSGHNFLLDYWIQGGALGLISILLLIYFSIRGLVYQEKMTELIAYLGILVAISFNPSSVVILVAFWWLISQGFSAVKPIKP